MLIRYDGYDHGANITATVLFFVQLKYKGSVWQDYQNDG